MTEKRFIAGIGAANMDLHGRSRAALILRDSNPGFLHTSPGGVTRNILENLSRMGEKTALFSAVGNDLYGREILASGEAVGMAQRFESVAPPGAVMLSESTARLVESAVTLDEPQWVRIKGADEPVRARRLLAVNPPGGPVRRTDSRLSDAVGRWPHWRP